MYISPGYVPFDASQLLSGAITSGDIQSGSISRFDLASGVVNSGHVASGAVLGQAGGGAFTIASGSIARFDLASGSVFSGHLVSGSVFGVNASGAKVIASGSIGTHDIGSGAIIWNTLASYSIKEVNTTPYTLLASDYTILANASGASLTINLMAANTASGRLFNVKKIDLSPNTVTLDANASETIDDATTLVLNTQYQARTIQCNGSGWFII